MSGLLTTEELAALHRHARAHYPAECCGVVLVRSGPAPTRRVLACRNIQDELHQRDPVRFPRTARTAYYIAHEDLLQIGRLEGEAFEVGVIYHSHIDADAYFSETDRRNALVDGVPAYPQATYVVVSVRGGDVAETRAHRWNETRREFVEVPLALADAAVRAENR